MKHKTYFTALILAFTITGCLKVQKKDEKRAIEARKALQVKTLINRDLEIGDVQYEYLGQPRPNGYDIKFSWPPTRDRLRISNGDQVLLNVDTSSEELEYIVKDFHGGDKFSLLIEVLDERSHIRKSGFLDIEIPKDNIYQGSTTLEYDTKIFEYRRVYLDHAVFTTQEFKLEIKAQELIVLNESVIQGFAPGTKARAGFEGRNGGFVNIEVESAEGPLTFLMNSEAGGDGLRGYNEIVIVGKDRMEKLIPKCAGGGSGYRAGRNGDLRLKINRKEKFRPKVSEIFAEGGNPGPKLNPSVMSHPAMVDESNCPQIPTKGALGISGLYCLISPDSILAEGCAL